MRIRDRIPVVCGIDVGSTNAKVVALDAEGTVIARASRATPRDGQHLSIDVASLMSGLEAMVANVCGDSHVVHAVACAGVGEDGVLVDATDHPLTDALAWFDPRRQRIFRELRPALGADDAFDCETDPARTLVGWRWSRRQASDADAASWIAVGDYPAVVWSGRRFLSDTLASRTAAWSSMRRRWDPDRVAVTLGSLDLLPEVLETGAVVGPLRSERLAGLGVLAPDALVVAGGHDHPIGGWGVSRLVTGAVLDSMGTAEVIVTQSTRTIAQRRRHVDLAPGIGVGAATTLLRVEELARNVAWASQDPDVGREIRRLLEGAVAPEPVLDSGVFRPGERGGGRPSYAPDAPRSPLARASAVLGALAHAGSDAVRAVQDVAGSSGEVRLAGGWARSPGWVEIKSLVNGRRTAPILEPEVTAVAAALLAAEACGWSPDPARAFGGFAAEMWRPPA